MEKMKCYILIKDDVPDEFAPVIAAHAALGMFLKWENHPDVRTWMEGPFSKVVCRVGEGEWNKVCGEEGCITMTESALDSREVALVFRPREEWPKPFRFFKKWSPKE